MKSESEEKIGLKPVVTADELLDCLFAEYDYWLSANCEASIGAVGAISNVIAFATVENFRAKWHPKKALQSKAAGL